MCGRFAVTMDPALLAAKIEAIDESAAASSDSRSGSTSDSRADSGSDSTSPANTRGPNYNVAPTTTIATVVQRHAEPDDEPTRRVRLMRWGLVPPWTKTAEGGGPDTKGPLLINARAETVTTSGAFRGAAKGKRCLVPMAGWYEWRGTTGKAKGGKTPFYMYGGDDEALYMAGLWSTWHSAQSAQGTPPLLSCTIITTDSAGALAEIHDRMPLTIGARDWDRWLDPDAPIDQELLRGHGDLDRIEIREVAKLVNNVRNNGPELIEPAEPTQPTLL